MDHLSAWRVLAKNKANEILQEVAPSVPLKAPVPIKEVIEAYKGDVQVKVSLDPIFPKEVSAFATKDMSLGWIVMVDGREPKVRRRFSAAHELAHMVLFPNQPKTVFCSHRSNDSYEDICDEFAGHILMPEVLVREFYESNPKASIEEFANAFDVSVQAAEIEHRYLGQPIRRRPV